MRRALVILFWSFHASYFAFAPVVVLASLAAGGYWLLHPAPAPEPEPPPDAAWFEQRFAEIQAIDARLATVQDAARRLYMDHAPVKRWTAEEDRERGRLGHKCAEIQVIRRRLVTEYNEKAAAVDEWDHPSLPRYIHE
jgi:hypothetical protein